MEQKLSYASYLLRLRQVENNRRVIWVASLQSTATGEQRPFVRDRVQRFKLLVVV